MCVLIILVGTLVIKAGLPGQSGTVPAKTGSMFSKDACRSIAKREKQSRLPHPLRIRGATACEVCWENVYPDTCFRIISSKVFQCTLKQTLVACIHV